MANAYPSALEQDRTSDERGPDHLLRRHTNDDDALALGKLLAQGGAKPALAYVRHSREFDPPARRSPSTTRIAAWSVGATTLGDESIPRHVVFAGSTGEGLIELAETEGASIIVFGLGLPHTAWSRRSRATRPSACSKAARWPSRWPPPACGLAAQMRFRNRRFGGPDDGCAAQAAEALAQNLGASVVPGGGHADLIVVGSPAISGEGGSA